MSMDWKNVIDHYYKEDTPLRHILLLHSRQVADRALAICDRHPELGMDRRFVEEAAMLHDIGIVACDAPGIHCHGTEPYICHGQVGGRMLRELGMDRHARVCERHTGAGLTPADIERQQLPLPQQSLMPETLEERLICYADKYYSKSHPGQEKTPGQAIRSLEKFGGEGVTRFRQWMELFEPEQTVSEG